MNEKSAITSLQYGFHLIVLSYYKSVKTLVERKSSSTLCTSIYLFFSTRSLILT